MTVSIDVPTAREHTKAVSGNDGSRATMHCTREECSYLAWEKGDKRANHVLSTPEYSMEQRRKACCFGADLPNWNIPPLIG